MEEEDEISCIKLHTRSYRNGGFRDLFVSLLEDFDGRIAGDLVHLGENCVNK